MEYFLNLPGTHFDKPGEWAQQAERQGWDGICASDHILVNANPYPHVFATATALALATPKVIVTTSFANNLFRSPVEFAQAAMTLQVLSNNRFEAGLGAGWAAHEVNAMGLTYPPPGERVGMYIEALTIVRELLQTGQCRYAGKFYQVDISDPYRLGPMPSAVPPLVASAGGPRNIRESTPLVDRMEIKANSRATRGGALDFRELARVAEDEIKQRIDEVRAIDRDMPIGIFLLIGVGDTPPVAALKDQIGDRFLGQFFGPADAVAEALEGLAQLGISRVQLTELVPGSQQNLAAYLCRPADARDPQR